MKPRRLRLLLSKLEVSRARAPSGLRILPPRQSISACRSSSAATRMSVQRSNLYERRHRKFVLSVWSVQSVLSVSAIGNVLTNETDLTDPTDQTDRKSVV